MMERTGLLLINLGSPASPSPAHVRAYLREFLSDPFVLDIPAPLRWLLLHGIILPRRSPRSAAAYGSIWTEEGSPLVVHTAQLTRQLRMRFAERAEVAQGDVPVVDFAMRYGQPSIENALRGLRQRGIRRVHAVPLYPQFAAATTGTVVHELQRVALADAWRPLLVSVEPPFYNVPGFAELWADRLRTRLASLPDPSTEGFHILFSFHGLPHRQILRSGSESCLTEGCCERNASSGQPNPPGQGRSPQPAPWCYRAQCLETARSVAAAAGLAEGAWSVSFQSRLGRNEWLLPSTQSEMERLLNERPGRGVVVAPLSFVADCLETLEELNLRAKEDLEASGISADRLHVLPSLNADPDWVEFLFQLVAKKV